MFKIVSNSSFDWGDAPLGSVIKVSSHGLVGADRQAFVKNASASLLEAVDSIQVKPGEELVHLIALGTTEDYGPNRNGDGFSKRACQDYHHYFVKDAKVYRNHQNTDPKKSYGVVKASAFNDQMSRVELIVALNGTEKAAKMNNGLVADKELDKLQSDKAMAVSMACRVPFDVCSYCGNKATTRDEYCTDISEGGKCKAGGLKHNLGKIVKVGGKIHHLYADNTKPYFFDISHVYIPADRIAYANGLCKRASQRPISGAELAEVYGLKWIQKTATDGKNKDQTRPLRTLCNAVTDFHDNRAWVKVATYLPIIDKEPLRDVQRMWQYKTSSVVRGLNDSGICLTPTQFVQLEYGLPFEKAGTVGEIIGPLSNERFRELLEEKEDYNPYLPADRACPKIMEWCNDQKCARWYGKENYVKQAAKNSINPLPPITISRETIYSLSDDETIKTISSNFALYKVAFLSSIQDPSERKRVADMLVGRDYLSY